MKQKVALVLSGGGAKGNAHIGVIEELEKNGFEISSVAGTSMGALVGGVYALGKLPEFKEWMMGLDRRKVFNLVDFTFSASGLVKGDKVLNAMKAFIADANIEDLKIPFAAVAADLVSKQEVVFRKGSVYDAIRASISIPTVLTPVKSGKKILVDGGVLNNIPVNHIARTENDILVAVNVGADVPVLKLVKTKKEVEKELNTYQKKMKEFQASLINLPSFNKKSHDENMGYFDLISRTINLMMTRISQLTLQLNHPDILINISRESCGTYDFYKAKQLIEIGKMAAKTEIEKYKS